MWDESSSSNTDVTVIPSQFKVTKQILLHWQPFRDLKLKYVGSCQSEQLSSHSQQRVVSTVEESVLKTEMAGLESQEEDAPKRILFFKQMSWLGQIRPHRRDQLDPLGDHLNTCTTRVPKRHTTGWLIKLLTFFAQRIRSKHNTWLKAEVSIVET